MCFSNCAVPIWHFSAVLAVILRRTRTHRNDKNSSYFPYACVCLLTLTQDPILWKFVTSRRISATRGYVHNKCETYFMDFDALLVKYIRSILYTDEKNYLAHLGKLIFIVYIKFLRLYECYITYNLCTFLLFKYHVNFDRNIFL